MIYNRVLLVIFIAFSLPAKSAGLLQNSGIVDIGTIESQNPENENEPPYKAKEKENNINNDVVDLNLLVDRTNQAMVLTSLNATQATFDKSGELDNTLRVSYSEAKIIKIRTREFMGTLIVLPEGDQIEKFTLMDVDNFTFHESPISDGELPRTGTVNVKLAGADTALHIIGVSGNIYSFYVRGDTWNSTYDPTMKVLISDENLSRKLKFKEMKAKSKQVADLQLAAAREPVVKKEKDYLESVKFDPSKLKFNYKIEGGDLHLKPIAIYNDGYFTYFRFAESDDVSGVVSFPSIYRVSDGSDVPVNISAQGSTLRVEGVYDAFTLRLGEKWLCIEYLEPKQVLDRSINELDLSQEVD